MKTRILSLVLVCCMGLLSSCNKDEPEPEPEDLWYWGTFEGEINGEKLSLKNENYQHGVYGKVERIGFNANVIDIFGTDIGYNDTSAISIRLHSLLTTEHYITSYKYSDSLPPYSSAIELYKESTINATICTYAPPGSPSKQIFKALYIPDKENPFRLEILRWKAPDRYKSFYFIEAKLDGVLYNQKDPKDALVIHGVYSVCMCNIQI